MVENGNKGLGPRLVVTGGIGAGKSTVTAMLAARGALVIEADRVGHGVLEAGKPAALAVAERWPEVVDAAGVVDRAKLATVVFGAPEELSALESITHPAIRTEILRRAASAGSTAVVVEMPLRRTWFAGWTKVAVVASPDVRRARAIARGGEAEDIRRRMASQPEDDDYTTGADHVIVNDGDLASLERAVETVWASVTT